MRKYSHSSFVKQTYEISNPTRIIMVLVGLFFYEQKVGGVHGRHGVVEKKQSGVGDKVWIGKRMVLFGESVWYNGVRQT